MSSRWGMCKGVLQKRVPENPKYKNVRPRVDSGASIRRYVERMQESQRDMKQKNDEVFKRIKITSFVKLIIETFNETLLNQSNKQLLSHSYNNSNVLNEKDIQNNRICKQTISVPPNRKPNVNGGIFSSKNEETSSRYTISNHNRTSVHREESVTSISTTRSTLQDVINGTGEMDFMLKYKNVAAEISQNTFHEPYVLLDVRDSDAYEQCHIITAKSYPYSMLIRTCNYETKEMLAYKNAKDKIIVVYDEDETVAPRVATTLVQRGYGNIFMLSGGLKLALYRFPEGLIEGTPPKSCRKETTATRSASMSRLITQVKATHLASKNTFTMDNIKALQLYLEKCLSVVGLSHDLSRSTQSIVSKSSYPHKLNPLTTKERTRPWK